MLYDGEGRAYLGKEVEKVVVDYFRDMFSSAKPNLEGLNLLSLQGRVSEDDCMKLIKPFTKYEVEYALKQIAPMKAPGPGGKCALFFQKYWDVVGGTISKVMLDVLHGGTMPPNFNHTIVSLILMTK